MKLLYERFVLVINSRVIIIKRECVMSENNLTIRNEPLGERKGDLRDALGIGGAENRDIIFYLCRVIFFLVYAVIVLI